MVPHSGAGTVPLAPPAFLEHLRTLPDAELRERLQTEMQPMSLGYFTSSVPVPPGWPALPGAYLAFGDRAYEDDIARARGFGWPVRVFPDAQHLHLAVAPRLVAEAVLTLAAPLRHPNRP